MLEALLGTVDSTSTEDDNSDLPFPTGTPYQGVTRSKNFISGPDLAALVGLTAGTPINDMSGWLHFIETSGQEIFVAKKPIRCNLSWNQVDAAQIQNTKEVTILGEVYIVSFLSGQAGDTGLGYGWERFLWNVYNNADRSGFPSAPIWGNYTAAMLGIVDDGKGGSFTMTTQWQSAPQTVMNTRGGGGYNTDRIGHPISAYWRTLPTSTVALTNGWRPALIKKSSLPFQGITYQANFIGFGPLATAVGLASIGTAINNNSNEAWFKFKNAANVAIYGAAGNLVYIPTKSIRCAITYEQLNALGLISGQKTIGILGKTYKVRCMLGRTANNVQTVGREWSTWITSLTDGTYAGAVYTAATLGTGTGGVSTGELVICQEADPRGGWATNGYPGIAGPWYMTANQSNSGYGWRPVVEEIPVESFTPPAVIDNTIFKGYVAPTDLIAMGDFLTLIGVSQYGNPMRFDPGWLQFVDGAKTLYINRKPLRYGVTVAQLKAAGLVAGKNITFGGKNYNVRLMTGMASSPVNNITTDPAGGEWNKYMYPIFGGTTPDGVAKWSSYTEDQLGLANSNSIAAQLGVITVCKEPHVTITTALAARGWAYIGTSYYGVNRIVRQTVINDANPSEGNDVGTLNVYGLRLIMELLP